jgi:hypothetical protein
MASKTSRPSMADPADQNVHQGKNPKQNPRDDLVDPGYATEDAPHDRGVVRDGNYEGAREEMIEQVGQDKDAWRRGKTQNS